MKKLVKAAATVLGWAACCAVTVAPASAAVAAGDAHGPASRVEASASASQLAVQPKAPDRVWEW